MEAVNETPGRLEPMRLGDESTALINDVLAELAFKAGRLDNALRGPLQAEAAGLVRLMNCYYSNLIEGHVTRPREIAAAVEGPMPGKLIKLSWSLGNSPPKRATIALAHACRFRPRL